MGIRALAGLVLSFFALTIVACGGSKTSGSSPSPAVADFQLTVGSSSVTTQQGGGTQFQSIRATPSNGFRGSVNFSVSGLPAGVSVLNLTPSVTLDGVFGSGSFQILASTAAAIGSSTITVTGTSGALSHSITFSLAVSQPAPFAIHVSPASLSLTPASNAIVQVTLTSPQGTSPQVGIGISAPPGNSQISIDSPQGFLTTANPVSFSITAPVVVQPVQNFSFVITASDNSGNTASFLLPLTVTVPPSLNILPTRSTFSRTDQDPTGLVYDPFRKLLFVSVEALNEVVVLSSVDGHKVGSIRVNFPAGIDEAADGSAVYVASPFIDGLTTIDPDLLQVVKHSSASSTVSGTDIPFSQVVTLSNGKVLLTPVVNGGVQPPFYQYDPGTDTFSPFGPQSLEFDFAVTSRNADHSKVLGYGSGSPSGILYDVTTNTFSGPNPAIDIFPVFSPDGSQFASIQSPTAEGILTFYDSHFTPLASLPANELSPSGIAPRLFYSRDGRFLYALSVGVGSVPHSLVSVVDTSTFKVIGAVPAFSFSIQLPFSGSVSSSFDLDETGMLFGPAGGGVGFLDLTSPAFMTEPMPAPFNFPSTLASLSAPTSALMQGGGFAQGLPLNVFIGAPPSSPQTLIATNLSVQDNNNLNLSIPAGITQGPANVTLTRSDGFFEVKPDAVTFGPTILQIDANAGSPSGGDTINIIGYGLPEFNTQVSIGGRPATVLLPQHLPISLQNFPIENVTVTTPPGSPGLADLTVSTPSGSTTVAGGFQYLNSVQVHPIVGALDAIVYDQSRKRLYITNQDHSRVEIYDTGTNTFPLARNSRLFPNCSCSYSRWQSAGGR